MSDVPPPFDPDKARAELAEKERESERKPLGGVPSDYTVPIRMPRPDFRSMSPAALERWTQVGHKPIEQGPRYFDGSEFAPAQLDPASIRALQADLVRAGLLTNFRAGIWDSASVKAYQELLGMANQYGLTDQAMLAHVVQNGVPVDFGGGGEGGQGGGPGLGIRTTNKDDLRRVFRAAVIDMLGQGWSQAQINELVDAYNWKEIQVQVDAAGQQAAAMEAQLGSLETGEPVDVSQFAGPAQDVESPETFLEDEVRRRDPMGVQATDIAEDYAPAFFAALGGYT